MAADTTIDELILDIVVKDEDSGKKVNALANALNRLNKIVDNLNLDKIADVFSNLTTSITPFTNKIASVKTELNALNKVLLKSGSFKKIAEDVKKPTKELNTFSKTVEKSTKKVSHQFAAFKRIAFYRFARMIIKEIAGAFRDGVGGLSEFDNSFKQTMNSLTASANKVKTSITVGLYQVLIMLEPVITNLANRVVEFANKMSLSLAIWRNSEDYIKVNTEAIEDYNKALKGTLLSFDTFETLAGKDGFDFSKAFETVKVSDATKKEVEDAKPLIKIFEALQKTFETLKPLVQNLWGVLTKVFEIIVKIIKTGIFEKIVNVVYNIVDFLDKNGLLEASLWGIFAVFVAIKGLNLVSFIVDVSTMIGKFFSNTVLLKGAVSSLSLALAGIMAIDLVSNWNEMSSAAKVVKLAIIGVTVALWAATAAQASLWSAVTLGVAAVAIVGAIAAITANIKSLKAASMSDIPNNEFGGGYRSADLFYANENGKTELIASNNSGGGSVMNLSQWAEVSEKSFLNALYKYGAAQNGMLGNLSVSFDGAEIARSKSFTGEINRRNSGMNLV